MDELEKEQHRAMVLESVKNKLQTNRNLIETKIKMDEDRLRNLNK